MCDAISDSDVSLSTQRLVRSTWTDLNWTPVCELQSQQAQWNTCWELTEHQPSLVSLPPINTKYNCDADARNQWSRAKKVYKEAKGVQRYGVSCTAQLPSPAESREEAPHCRSYFNLQNYFGLVDVCMFDYFQLMFSAWRPSSYRLTTAARTCGKTF